ncbi:MAG: flagellar hook-length control protein FliK [Sideroxydans sp.]
MPVNPLAAALTKLALNEKPLIAAATDKPNPKSGLKLDIGQQVQGTVQAQTAPGQFQVRIADHVVQLQLPAFVRSGDLISLQVTSLQPRLAFSLSSATNPVSTSEQLSSASRMLSSMTQQPLEQPYVKSLQRAPLWIANQASAPDTTVLADKLHHALSHSGLFYESHQVQWIAGMRSTPQLMQEPQNQLPQQNTAILNEAVKMNAPATPSTIPEHLQNLVQQQLHALENRQVLWQGVAWEGQEMRWEVREESPRRSTTGEPEGQWITEIHLDLPRLGNLSARLSLNGGAVNLTFSARDEKTRELLGNASTQLVSALNERDIPVLQTRIEKMEEALR